MAFFARDGFICTCRKEECDMCNKKYFEPITNADRIRSMTDEELAWFFYTKTGCDHKCMHWKSKSCSSPDFTKVCGEVWLDWLMQKSEDKP